MEKILQKNPFETQIALLKTPLETFAVGLKNSWNKKEEKTFFVRTEFVYSKHSTRQMKGSF